MQKSSLSSASFSQDDGLNNESECARLNLVIRSLEKQISSLHRENSSLKNEKAQMEKIFETRLKELHGFKQNSDIHENGKGADTIRNNGGHHRQSPSQNWKQKLRAEKLKNAEAMRLLSLSEVEISRLSLAQVAAESKVVPLKERIDELEKLAAAMVRLSEQRELDGNNQNIFLNSELASSIYGLQEGRSGTLPPKASIHLYSHST